MTTKLNTQHAKARSYAQKPLSRAHSAQPVQ